MQRFIWIVDDNYVGTSQDLTYDFSDQTSGLFVAHKIKLTSFDENDCSNNIEKLVKVSFPKAIIDYQLSSPVENNINEKGEYKCPPVISNYKNASTSIGKIDSVFWNFGIGKKSILMDPTTLYLFPGIYTTTLKCKDQFGCVSDTIMPNFLTILGPKGQPRWEWMGDVCYQKFRFIADSLENVSNLEPIMFPYKKDKLRKMYVEVFGGVGQSYIKNETNQNVVNATIGGVIGVSFPVKRFNISAGLGLQGTKFDQLNILERTKIYGLGSEILENSYEFSSIYSLTIPLSATYTIGRHSMSLGITSNINLMTQLKHRQTLDGAFKSYNVGFSDVSFFNRFGLLPSLGYSFHINEKTQIGIRMNIQLLQQIQSKRFIGAPLNFPIDGQIYLKRTLDF